MFPTPISPARETQIFSPGCSGILGSSEYSEVSSIYGENFMELASGYVKIAIGRSTMLLMGKRTHYVDWAMASIAM